jgi:hypothetical protein
VNKVSPWGAYQSRETTEAEHRARAREKVASAARRGEDLAFFPADDLAWAFKGHEGELAELEQLATRAREANETAKREAERSRELRRVTERIEGEMIETEKRERRERATAEAKRRLGWED